VEGSLDSPRFRLGEAGFGRDDEEGESEDSYGSVAASHKIALVLITSNRGLAGSFNANMIAMAQKFALEEKEAGREIEVITVGKKGRDALVKRGFKIVADFEKADVHEKVEELRPIIKLVMDEYVKGAYARVMIAYTDFVSALTQKPRIKQLLPIVGEDQYLSSVNRTQTHLLRNHTQVEEDTRIHASLVRMDAIGEDGYLFEPSPAAVLEALLPRVVEIELYQMILESDASEHSARMFAMRNATEAAGDMMNELTFLFNQTRQAGITQEIAEISAGRIAIER